MSGLEHTYGYTSEVTNETWTRHPDIVQNDAAEKLKGAIRNDGRKPVGRIYIVGIRGLTYCSDGIKRMRGGYVWVPTHYERHPTEQMEWRDEIFCDPEKTVQWRVSYAMKAHDVMHVNIPTPKASNGFKEIVEVTTCLGVDRTPD